MLGSLSEFPLASLSPDGCLGVLGAGIAECEACGSCTKSAVAISFSLSLPFRASVGAGRSGIRDRPDVPAVARFNDLASAHLVNVFMF